MANHLERRDTDCTYYVTFNMFVWIFLRSVKAVFAQMLSKYNPHHRRIKFCNKIFLQTCEDSEIIIASLWERATLPQQMWACKSVLMCSLPESYPYKRMCDSVTHTRLLEALTPLLIPVFFVVVKIWSCRESQTRLASNSQSFCIAISPSTMYAGPLQLRDYFEGGNWGKNAVRGGTTPNKFYS